MAYYPVPGDPVYDLSQIRRIENSDPVNAEQIVNPVIEKLIENIAAVHSGSTNIVVSARPPIGGPALWFCTDRDWRPEPEIVATAILGDPADADAADVTSEVNSVVYPVLNATISEKDGTIVAVIEQS